ncbi:MAG: TonB-dependent receptor [Burkholderiales bacterium]|jgi:outer membrane receptor protein involved in Fe transport|nr:TonB-dependent receptor [Burkholderiales bacterium]
MHYGFFILVFLLSFNAIANESVHDLPPIVVTEQEGFREVEKITSSHNIIFDEEVIENSTAETLSDFLQQMGFAVIPGATPYETTTITIRGYDNGHHWNESSSRIIFLINGRRSGVNDIRQLALNNVERIEVIRGPEMYKYSAGSPGGIVNIITKRGGKNVLSGSLEAGVGSYDQRKGQLALNGTASGFDYSLSYRYETVNDYKDGKGNKVTNSGFDSINAFNGRLGYTLPDNNHKLGIEYYYYNVDDAHKPQYWDEEEGVLKDPSIVDRKTYLAAITYDGTTSDRSFNWTASYSISQDEYISINNPSRRYDQYWMGNKIETNQARAGVNYIGDLFDFSVGADYIKYKTHNSGTPKPQFGWLEGYPLHLGHTTANMGLYTLGTLKLPKEKLSFTGGLRWEYARIQDKHTGDEPWWDGRKDPWYGDDTNENMPTKRTFDYLSPSIGATYLPFDWLKLRANYVRGFRAPGGRQLFSSDETEGYGAPGYPLLKAEKSDNYEAGFDVNWNHADFSLTYFYSKFKNHITIRGIQYPTGLGPSAQNADERIQSGIEVGGSINLANLAGFKDFEFRPYANITYMIKYDELFMRGFDGSQLSNPSYAGEWAVINSIPEYSASYGIRFYHFGWGTAVNLNLFYFGETWTGSSPGNYNPNLWSTYGKFNIANLSISQSLYKFSGGSDVTLKLHINNLFDKAYNYSANANDVLYNGRNFYLGMSFNF